MLVQTKLFHGADTVQKSICLFTHWHVPLWSLRDKSVLLTQRISYSGFCPVTRLLDASLNVVESVGLFDETRKIFVSGSMAILAIIMLILGAVLGIGVGFYLWKRRGRGVPYQIQHWDREERCFQARCSQLVERSKWVSLLLSSSSWQKLNPPPEHGITVSTLLNCLVYLWSRCTKKIEIESLGYKIRNAILFGTHQSRKPQIFWRKVPLWGAVTGEGFRKCFWWERNVYRHESS